MAHNCAAEYVTRALNNTLPPLPTPSNQANGGSNNAFTDSEETVYFFDVGGSALPGALSRFADFFVSPLFTEAATAREVAAIDSEHSKNLQVSRAGRALACGPTLACAHLPVRPPRPVPLPARSSKY